MEATRPNLWYGPCLGEFAFEMMAVTLMRRIARKYKTVTVCTRPGREPLYLGIKCNFVAHDIVCEGNCETVANYNYVPPADLSLWRPGDTTTQVMGQLYLGHLNATQLRLEGEFLPYGKMRDEYKNAVVMHVRTRQHVPSRNWPQANHNKLARRLFEKGVSRILTIGSPTQASTVEGAMDLRGAGLQEQMDALRSAQLCVGVSSGPMHLAQQCLCPVVVWCGGGEHERETTKARYLKTWNLRNTAATVMVVPDWKPKYERVEGAVLDALNTLPQRW